MSKEFIHLRMTGQDRRTECTEHMVYIGLNDGGSGLLIHLYKCEVKLSRVL